MADSESGGGFTANEDQAVDRMEHWHSAEAQKRSLANLRPWSADRQPKNPGRKRSEVDQLIKKFGRSKIPGDPKSRTFFAALVERLFVIAIRGNVDAARLIVERIGGRAMAAHEMDAAAAAPTAVIVNVGRDVVRFPEYTDGLAKIGLTSKGPQS